ncbi:hypothetical protein B0H16DRAFT_1773849 [Mycena metata]|uniref:Uncharacterized protein n=1 Tax=Mycena metata TaxID=1033252 RepID=A0AAD7HX69_9AGAR|nr:hypothetical protein B0H16DRAFT_1773849 [Mycena metata]
MRVAPPAAPVAAPLTPPAGPTAAPLDLESELKLAKAEAKSNSSGRVRVSKVAVERILPVPDRPAEAAVELTPVAPPVVSSAPSVAAPAPIPDGDLVATGMRRVSTRKRPQAEASATVPRVTPSNKRRKKLEDPLVGWMMQDPDTGEELTGHEWVKRYPDEFEQRYKKDHQRYLDYLAQ